MRRLCLVWLGVLVLVSGACSDSSPSAAPVTSAVPAETTTVPVSTTVRPTSTTTSTTIRPTTTVTTPLSVGPGDASIGGTVTGPAGPVDGATVRIERLVGKNVATADVTTSGGGSWQMSVLGGSYRIRAFKAPDFGQSTVEAFFLAANDRKTIDLKVPVVSGERIIATVNPNPPRVDQAASLIIQVGVGRVDDQGRPALTPRPGVLLSLVPGPGILLESASQALTDGNGSAAFSIRCAVEGARSFSLTVGVGVTTVNIPPCSVGGPSGATTTRPR